MFVLTQIMLISHPCDIHSYVCFSITQVTIRFMFLFKEYYTTLSQKIVLLQNVQYDYQFSIINIFDLIISLNIDLLSSFSTCVKLYANSSDVNVLVSQLGFGGKIILQFSLTRKGISELKLLLNISLYFRNCMLLFKKFITFF